MAILPPYITKKQATFIKRLLYKKYRTKEKAFVVQGYRSIQDLLASDYKVLQIVATPAFIQTAGKLLEGGNFDVFCASPTMLPSLGTFKTNNAVLAVVQCKENVSLDLNKIMYGLVLDNINNPSNLGSILRIADWYGITNIVCSPTTVEKYNPKVIQASMGSFARVHLYYTPLKPYLKQAQVPIIGAVLGGENLHKTSLPTKGLLVVGNEAIGISSDLVSYMTQQVSIPSYRATQSLNVAVATAIICDRWLQDKPI